MTFWYDLNGEEITSLWREMNQQECCPGGFSFVFPAKAGRVVYMGNIAPDPPTLVPMPERVTLKTALTYLRDVLKAHLGEEKCRLQVKDLIFQSAFFLDNAFNREKELQERMQRIRSLVDTGG